MGIGDEFLELSNRPLRVHTFIVLARALNPALAQRNARARARAFSMWCAILLGGLIITGDSHGKETVFMLPSLRHAVSP